MTSIAKYNNQMIKSAENIVININRAVDLSKINLAVKELLRIDVTRTNDSGSMTSILAQEIAVAVTECPLMTVEDIANRIQSPDLLDLIEKVRLPGAKFPIIERDGKMHNAYQSLLWLFRGIPKRNYHTHISMGVHESIMANIIVTSDDKEYSRMIKNLNDDNKNGGIKKLSSSDFDRFKHSMKSFRKEGDVSSIADILHKYPIIKDWDRCDFFVTSSRTLEMVTEAAASNQLYDGVTSFDLRYNPIKIFLLDIESRSGKPRIDIPRIVELAVECAYEGISKAMSNGGVVFNSSFYDIGTLWSFNRTKLFKRFKGMPMSKAAVKSFAEINLLKKRHPSISGMDISGPEFSIDDYDPIQWQKAVDSVLSAGMKVIAHLGDTRNIRSGHMFNLGILALEAFEKGNYEKFELHFSNLMYLHIKSVERMLNILPNGTSIGHAYALNPEYIKSRLWNDISIFGIDATVFNDRLSKEYISIVKELKDQIKDKNISIEHCPTTTVRSDDVALFDKLPIHNWIHEGLNVVLGTDGTFFLNRPRTLSEDMVRLLLSRSDRYGYLTFQDIFHSVGY